MSKKKSKKPAVRGKKEKHPPPGKKSVIERIFRYKYFPVIFFLILSSLYFYRYLIDDVALLTTDGGILGLGPYEPFTKVENPFAESRQWDMHGLGGQPASQGLNEYTKNLFTKLIFGFLPRQKGHGEYKLTKC